MGYSCIIGLDDLKDEITKIKLQLETVKKDYSKLKTEHAQGS